jgi:hypothetical protein
VQSQKLPSFWSFLWISLVLSVIGWGGLILLIFMTQPTLGPRWLFFFLFTLALSGTALPVTYFINRRFPADPPVDGGVVLREAMWFGVYGSLLAWLQMGDVLTSGLAFVLAMGLIVIEFLLRMGERSQWSPAQRAAVDGVSPDAGGGDASDEDDDGEEEEEDA